MPKEVSDKVDVLYYPCNSPDKENEEFMYRVVNNLEGTLEYEINLDTKRNGEKSLHKIFVYNILDGITTQEVNLLPSIRRKYIKFQIGGEHKKIITQTLKNEYILDYLEMSKWAVGNKLVIQNI